MINIKKILLLMMLMMTPALFAMENGEQSLQVGPYKVYYNSFNTSFLSPDIAKQYGIKRTSNSGLVNISIKKFDGENSVPVAIKLSGYFKNLLSQTQELNFRMIQEKEAIYYLADFTFSDQDRLSFTIQLDLDEKYQEQTLQFTNQFYFD